MTNVWRQFKVLFWKNCIIQIRNPKVTLAEFLIPAFLTSLLLIGRGQVEPILVKNVTTWDSFVLDSLDSDYVFKPWSNQNNRLCIQEPSKNSSDSLEIGNLLLAYSPMNDLTTDFMNEVKDIIQNPTGSSLFSQNTGLLDRTCIGTGARELELKGFKSHEDMNKYMSLGGDDDTNSQNVFYGINFKNDEWSSGTMLPKTFDYSLRPVAAPRSEGDMGRRGWVTNLLFDARPGQNGPMEKKSQYGGRPYYYNELFLDMQHIVDFVFIGKVAEQDGITDYDKNDYKLKYERFPFPSYTDDPFLRSFSDNLPLVLFLAFVYFGAQTAKMVAIEKETKLKEYMLMMGLSRNALWASWYLHYFLLLIIPCLLTMVVLTCELSSYGSVLQMSDSFIVFIFLMLWGCSLISLGFLISSFFSKANTVSSMSALIIWLCAIPYDFIKNDMENTSTVMVRFIQLFGPSNMSLGCYVISVWESKGEGIQWSNLGTPISPSLDLTMSSVFIFFIINTIVYHLLTRYMDLVKTGDWGIPLPWYFCVTRNFWFGNSSKSQTSILTDTSASSGKSILMQSIKTSWKKTEGFKVKDVVKEFTVKGEIKRAVDGLSFSAMTNEITVLLGHNGAGKSTTMSMLTGMVSPDSGSLFVGDLDVTKDTDKARKTIGFCPQHNILISELNVDEHFKFFAQLKGFSLKQAEEELETLVYEVQLGEKRKVRADNLSGGMKRKLSLGVAVCGDSKHLILDEPSSGIDVTARRELWTILEKYRESRTMLISTHYMDEAEALADQIIIISKGSLKCSGSTSFLKNNLGDGYHLALSLKESHDINALTAFIKNYTPEAKLGEYVGSEAQFTLPFSSASIFPDLFRAIDANQEIGIDSYGASITTMDEIFLKVTHQDEVEQESENSHLSESEETEILSGLSESVKLIDDKKALLKQQFRGAFIKCYLHAIRNWKLLVFQFLIPTFMTILAIIQILSVPEIGAQPELCLSLAPYKSDLVKMPLDIHTPLDLSKEKKELFENIIKDSTLTTESDLEKWIPDKTDEMLLAQFNNKYVLAFQDKYEKSDNRSDFQLKTWFNPEAFHSVAAGVFYSHQFVLHSALNDSYSIKASNHPLPPNNTEALSTNVNYMIQGTIVSINVVFGVMFMFSVFSMLPVRERENGVKTLQKCSGAPLWLTWAANYCWDLLNALPSLLFIIIIFASSQSIAGFATFAENTDCIFVLFLLFALAQLPFTYCLSFAFKVPASAIMTSSVLNIMLSLVTYLAVFILKIIESTRDIGNALNNVFLVFPQFCFAMGLFDVYNNANLAESCEKSALARDACASDDYFSYTLYPWSFESGGIGRYLLALFLQIPVFFSLLALIEWEIATKGLSSIVSRLKFWKKSSAKTESISEGDDSEDMDVATIRKEITSSQSKDIKAALLAIELKKDYKTKENGIFHAVQNVSFLVKPGECFGLLGPNGAGKTTTFKMLTGEHSITSGNAFIDQIDLSTDRMSALRRYGYCPQFDALLEQLTGRETLFMYSRLRGVPEEHIEELSSKILKLLGIEIHAEKQVQGYSGGTKRKLSVGLALIGFPPLLMLDEPSCGLDPGARRKLWNVVSNAQKVGAAVLLTSHSMEECAALCNRLAIMVNGKFKCIGGQQHLKSKFGQGPAVEIQVGDEDVNKVYDLTMEMIPGLTMKDKFQGSIKFIAARDTSLADIFEQLEKLKQVMPISGYTVNQATLEQIFLTMTESQKTFDV